MRTISCLLLILSITAGSLFGQWRNAVLGVGYTPPPATFTVALGQPITLFTEDLGVPDAVAQQVPVPTVLSGVSVAVSPRFSNQTENYPRSLPVLRIYSERSCRFGNTPLCPNTQITVQIPVDQVCGMPVDNRCAQRYPPELVLNIRANCVSGPDVHVVVGTVAHHLLNSCDSIFGPPGDFRALITHADGSLVTRDKPAHPGETITAYEVGGDAFDRESVQTGYRRPRAFKYSQRVLPLAIGSTGTRGQGLATCPCPIW